MMVEMTYKIFWVAAVVVPYAITNGSLPTFALLNAVGWVVAIVGYAIAIPWKLVFKK